MTAATSSWSSADACRAPARHPHRPACGPGHGRLPPTGRAIRTAAAGHHRDPQDDQLGARHHDDLATIPGASSSPSTRRCTTLTTAPPSAAQVSSPVLCRLGGRDQLRRALGGVQVSLAGPLIRRRAELQALGWQVRVLEGGWTTPRPCRPSMSCPSCAHGSSTRWAGEYRARWRQGHRVAPGRTGGGRGKTLTDGVMVQRPDDPRPGRRMITQDRRSPTPDQSS
jgi:hypothetical protein